MKQIKRHSVAVVAGAALWGLCGASHGIGLGRPDSQAIMGQPLTLSVPVRLEAGEHLEDECLAADVFYGEEKLMGSQVRARLVTDTNGTSSVRVLSNSPISEPVVTVYVVVGCQARITRKFVALADPPGVSLPLGQVAAVQVASAAPAHAPDSAAPSRAAAEVVQGTSVASTQSSGSRAGRHAEGSARHHARHTGSGADPAQAGAAQVRPSLSLAAQARVVRGGHDADARQDGHRASKSSRAASALASADGGHLELDPVAADALVEPHLKLGATLALVPDAEGGSPEVMARRASAAAYWRALQATPDQLARDQERLAALERRVAELQAQQDNHSASDAQAVAHEASAPVAVAAAASRPMSDTQHSRLSSMIGLGAAIALGLGYVLWRGRAKGRTSDAWWQAQAGETVPPPMSEVMRQEPQDPQSTTVEFVHVPEQLLPPVHFATESVAAMQASPASALPPARMPGAPFAAPLSSLFSASRPGGDESLRAVAVEELIDLEQQAEFFIVLGQDDAAIDLLEGYAQHTAASSPLPLLKLLEIYRRLGRRDDYERTQRVFDAQFNAHAPSWDDDMQHGHSLADYPEVISRLQALWPQPSQSMVVLEKSLMRPTEGDETFDLPAYRELLMLYAVARDLAEREAPGGKVDVLLPLASGEAAGSVDDQADAEEGTDTSPLMATRPVQAQGGRSAFGSLHVDLDVDLDVADDPATAGMHKA